MAVVRRQPLDAAVVVVLPVTVLLFAFGSSAVPDLVRIGSRGRWIALFLLGVVALLRGAARAPMPIRALPGPWAAALGFLLLAADSALWSVEPGKTLGRTVAMGVVFAVGSLLAIASNRRRPATPLVLESVLAGVVLVALASLVLLVADHRHAIQPATGGSGWRFQGIGQNPDTLPMLFAVGLPLAVAFAAGHTGWWRAAGLGALLLLAGEAAASASRGGMLAGFAGAAVTAFALGRGLRARLALTAGVVALAAVCVGVSRLPSPRAPSAAATPPAAAPAPAPRHDAEQVARLQDEIGRPVPGVTSTHSVPQTILGTSGRAEAWNGAWQQGLHRPLVGYGFGTENRVFVDRYFSFEGAFVENTYLGLFLQLGFVGLALFLAVLVGLGRAGVVAAARGSTPAAGALGVLVSGCLIGIVQSGLLSAGNVAAVGLWLAVLTLPVLERATADP